MKSINEFNVVWISLTYNCNNKCEWCYAASNCNSNKRKTFNSEYESGVINLLKSLKIKRTILIGGEPTLYPSMNGLLKKLSNTNIHVGIVSNGRKFKNKSFAKNIKKLGVNDITISVEGDNELLHDSITQIPGSFNETLQGIQTAYNEGINISLNTVINPKNIINLEGILDLAVKNDLNSVTFNICGVCISQEQNNSRLINPKQSIQAFERIYPYAKSLDIRTRLVTPMPLCFFDKKLLPELKEKNIVSGGPCQLAHGKNFVIDYNGDVLPCTHFTGFPLFNLFRNNKIISTNEFLDEYNDSSKISYQFRQSMRKYASSSCDDSKCNEPCSGGCPIFWVKYNPEQEIKTAHS